MRSKLFHNAKGLFASLLFLLTLGLSTQTSVAAPLMGFSQQPKPAVSQSAESKPAQPAADDTATKAYAEQYAARENKKDQLEKFEGGSVVIITSSTAAVVLAIILLVVLL